MCVYFRFFASLRLTKLTFCTPTTHGINVSNVVTNNNFIVLSSHAVHAYIYYQLFVVIITQNANFVLPLTHSLTTISRFIVYDYTLLSFNLMCAHKSLI
jgi:hypothetical protein